MHRHGYTISYSRAPPTLCIAVGGGVGVNQWWNFSLVELDYVSFWSIKWTQKKFSRTTQTPFSQLVGILGCFLENHSKKGIQFFNACFLDWDTEPWIRILAKTGSESLIITNTSEIRKLGESKVKAYFFMSPRGHTEWNIDNQTRKAGTVFSLYDLFSMLLTRDSIYMPFRLS